MDDFWVFGQGFYTDYYVIHRSTFNQLEIAPTDVTKKPKLRQDSLPPEDFLNLFSWLTFSVKIILFIVFVVGSITFTIIALEGKAWKGFSFLNKSY